MGVKFDRWTLLKLVEVALVIVCLTYKRVTDDEAFRLNLYLQKISREWSLLNNVTWSKVGGAVADAAYGGYLIITAALFIGRLTGELPTQRRITEFVLLGIGAVLFIALGSLAFASLESVPPDLVDNAAIVGTISVVTGALFLLDMGGPKAKKPQQSHPRSRRTSTKPLESKSITQQVYDIEKGIQDYDRKHLDTFEPKKTEKEGENQGIRTGKVKENGGKLDVDYSKHLKGYQQMREDFPRKFGIYGKDVADYGNDTEINGEVRLPPKMEAHSPVWSHIRKGRNIGYSYR